MKEINDKTKSAREVYLCLLRAALWNETPDIRGEVDWKGVCGIAMHQTTIGLIGQAALQMEGKNAPPENVRAWFLKQIGQISRQYAKLNETMVRAVEKLRSHGIEPVLLKGCGLAANYPYPDFRQCGDIDLYVGQDKYREGCAAMHEMTDFVNHGPEKETDHHYEMKKGNLIIEIHRVAVIIPDAKERIFYQDIEKEGLSKNLHYAEIGGLNVALPSDTFNAFYVFFHILRHYMEWSISFRQICDWTMLLHALHEHIDMAKLKTYIEGLHLMKPWKTFGCIAVDVLGLPNNEMPFYDSSYVRRASKVLHFVWTEGNFKHSNSQQGQSKKSYCVYYYRALFFVFGEFKKLCLVAPCLAMKRVVKIFFHFLYAFPNRLAKNISKIYCNVNAFKCKTTYKVARQYFRLIMPKNSVLCNKLDNYKPFETKYDVSASLAFSAELVEPFEVNDKVSVYCDNSNPDMPRLEVFRSGTDWLVEVAPVANADIVGRILFSEDFSKVRFCIINPREAEFVLNDAMMLAFAFSTVDKGVMEMHASVVVNAGHGFLFLGSSGTGKSTHSRLWLEHVAGSVLLNDDNPIVVIDTNGRVMVYGSPWSGKTPCYKNESYPVGAFVSLRQSKENAIDQLGLLEAYGAVFSSTSCLKTETGFVDALHEAIEKVVTRVPCYRLDCLPNKEAALLCAQTIASL